MPEALYYTLSEAASRFFGGAVKASTLRAEIARGNLAAAKIGRSYMVSEADIRIMIERCRAPAKAPASTMTTTVQAGVSATDRRNAVLACQEAIKKLRNKGSQPTSPRSTGRQPNVIPLASR